MMLLLSATGIATYNTMSYIGLTSTTALNVLLLQSAGPLIIIVWAFALFGERPTPWQSAGVLLSLVGVATIAAHGSLEALLHLTLNPRRCLDPGRDADLRHLRRDVPRASRGASDEFPGRHAWASAR